jgi:hypothetical protein
LLDYRKRVDATSECQLSTRCRRHAGRASLHARGDLGAHYRGRAASGRFLSPWSFRHFDLADLLVQVFDSPINLLNEQLVAPSGLIRLIFPAHTLQSGSVALEAGYR